MPDPRSHCVRRRPRYARVVTDQAFYLSAAIALLLAVCPQIAWPADGAPAGLRTGVLDRPCAALEPAPPRVATALAAGVPPGRSWPAMTPAELQSFLAWQQRLLVSDFAGLCHYEAANIALAPPSANRVVFFGDSITELWGRHAPGFFQADVIDRGISGQTTAQMIGRFRADVIDLKPQIVHILAGTNDIAGNTGPTSLSRIEANIETMVDLARSHHIAVIIGTIPPARRFDWRTDIAPIPRIAAYNLWLIGFARREGLTLVDYYALLDDGHGAINAALSDDGVHPNAAGYALITPSARRAIADARRRASQ